VVLEWGLPYPLDLLDHVRSALDSGVPTFLTRQEGASGERRQRRICLVIPRDAVLAGNYLECLVAEAPVYRELSLSDALNQAAGLQEQGLGVRILDARKGFRQGAGGELSLSGEDAAMLRKLSEKTDPEGIAFADRTLEAWWIREALGHRSS
jgi:hypothetical protein